jgi:pantetheine-phosphate adenylyltransferase
MTTALCPGSFDPPTNGHVDVIERAIAAFDRVVVAVVDNPAKESLFSTAERISLLEDLFGAQVEIGSFSGLLVEYAAEVGADVVVKGLRTVDDYE